MTMPLIWNYICQDVMRYHTIPYLEYVGMDVAGASVLDNQMKRHPLFCI